MEDERMKIIRAALSSKLGNGFSMFTDTEVLTAAGFTELDVESLQRRYDRMVSQAARNAEKNAPPVL